MLLAAFSAETWTSTAAVAAVTLLLLVRLRNRRRRASITKATGEAVPNGRDLRQRDLATTSAARTAERQLVEQYEFAREIEARLDVKRALLEQLLQDADERIARLEALEQAGKRSDSADSRA